MWALLIFFAVLGVTLSLAVLITVWWLARLLEQIGGD